MKYFWLKTDSDEHAIDSVVLRCRIVKLNLEKEASDAKIAELTTQLAAEQSKNATMEVEVLIRKEQCQDLKTKLANAWHEVGRLQNAVAIATSPPSEAKTDYPNKKSFVSSRIAHEETHSSPSSPEPPLVLQNEVLSINGYDENNNAHSSPVAAGKATKQGVGPVNAAMPKASKELTTYFRTLEDHGLSPDEIVEYLRRTYPDMACNFFPLLQALGPSTGV